MSAGDQIWTLVGRLTLPVVASFILVLLGARISTPEWAFIATVATLVLVRYAVLQAAGHLRAAGGFFCTGLVGTATAITIMTAFTPVEHLSKVMDTISTTGYSLGACWTIIGLILGSQSVPSLCRVGVLIAVVVCQGLYNGTAYMKTGDERIITFVLPMEASCSAFGTLFARVLWCHWERASHPAQLKAVTGQPGVPLTGPAETATPAPGPAAVPPSLALASLRVRGASQPSSPADIPPADIDLGTALGRGGQGSVYSGHWLGTPVALKVVEDESKRGQLQKEAALLASLRHPCICAFYGTSQVNGCLVSVLELLECSLSDLLSPHASRPPWLCYRIAHETAMGIAYLHRANVLHRVKREAVEPPHRARARGPMPRATHCRPAMQDIKACNVMLDKGQNAKVCDFGLAKPFTVDEDALALGSDAERRASEHSRTCGIGTLRYMAPEVMLRTEHQVQVRYNAAADVYSYGLLLWELTHGATAFRGYDGICVACQLAPGGQRPPLALPAELESLGPLITSCWRQDPAQRPTMAECANILQILRRDVRSTASSPAHPFAASPGASRSTPSVTARDPASLRSQASTSGSSTGLSSAAAFPENTYTAKLPPCFLPVTASAALPQCSHEVEEIVVEQH